MSCSKTVRQDWMERVAIGASLLCLVHCLALPIAIAMLPALAHAMPIPEDAHVWLLIFVIPAAGLALWSGYRTHCDIWPLFAGSAGIALLASAVLLMSETGWEMPLTVAGSLTVVFAHVLNWRLRHACRPTKVCEFSVAE